MTKAKGEVSKSAARVLTILNEAAEQGLPCPTNQEIIARLGFSSPSSSWGAISELTHAGKITVTRTTATTRRVTIVATGKETGPPVMKPQDYQRSAIRRPRESAGHPGRAPGVPDELPPERTVCWRCGAASINGCDHLRRAA